MSAEAFKILLEEVKRLANAKEKGSAPKSKELVIRHDGAIERLEKEEHIFLFDAMKDDCRDGLINVSQRIHRTPKR